MAPIMGHFLRRALRGATIIQHTSGTFGYALMRRAGEKTSAKLNDLELAALLCSRLCHDLISPIGAVNNGIEVLMEDGGEELAAQALELVRRRGGGPALAVLSSCVRRVGRRQR